MPEAESRRQRYADCNSVEDTQRPGGASEETSKRNQKMSGHPVMRNHGLFEPFWRIVVVETHEQAGDFTER